MIRRESPLFYFSFYYGAALGLLMGLIYALTNPFGWRGGIWNLAFKLDGYLACALAGWVAAVGISLLLRWIRHRRTGGQPDPGRLYSPKAAFGRVCIALAPAWFWNLTRDSWIYPDGAWQFWLSAALALLVHLAVLFFGIRRRSLHEHHSLGKMVRWGAAGIVAAALAVSILALAGSKSASGGEDKRQNIVLIVLDTVSAKRMSLYGAPRQTSLELERLARRGRYYTGFYSTSCWTVPSHASLFTGLYPVRHQATQESVQLREEWDTLAEILRQEGYRTIGISGNPAVCADLGFAQGFDAFLEMWRGHIKGRYSPARVHPNNRAAEQFLKHRSQDRPFFLFLNYIEAHSPYEPPRRFLRSMLDEGDSIQRVLDRPSKRPSLYYLKQNVITTSEFMDFGRLYDGELAYLSWAIEELFLSLEKQGLTKNTLVIVTSDHGENLGDHGHYTHVFSLYNTTQWVPLIVLDPNEKEPGKRIDALYQIHDLFPALLDAAGVDSTKVHHQGIDLFDPAFEAGRDAVYGEYYFPLQVLDVMLTHGMSEESIYLEPYMRRLRCVQSGGMKLIWGSDGRHELYSTAEDPEETTNLVHDPRYVKNLKELEQRLDDFVSKYSEGVPLPEEPTRLSVMEGFIGKVDEETAEQLRALGYLR